MDEEMKITVQRDGPYLVTGNVPLQAKIIVCDESGTPIRWEPGERYPAGDTYNLCRCGRSADRPYCDGAHAEAGFRDGRQAPREDYFEATDVIEGPGVILYDVPALCARAGFCHRGGNIWHLAATGRIRESIDLVIRDACDCPSGRLVASDLGSRELLEPELTRSISVVEIPAAGTTGPLWVKAGIPLESIDGWLYEIRNRMALCRCGASGNMPFCDGAHASLDSWQAP